MPKPPAAVTKSLTLTKNFYQDLITAIHSALASGLLAAQKAVEYQRLKTYWQIGRDIRAAVEASNGALGLGENLYRRISRDIERETGLCLTIDTLGRTVQFHKNYPVFPEGTPLTFTHYLAIQRLNDAKLRTKIEKAAIRKNMTVPQLKEEIMRLSVKLGPEVVPPAKRLTVERGEPYVYYVRPEVGLDGRTTMRIDCGFKLSQDIPSDNPYVPDQARVVRSVKKDGKYSIHEYREGQSKLYTYAAKVLRVVDGDTMDVRIDVGFGIGLYDRLRLKWLNAPEVTIPAGRLAASFLTDHFARCPDVVLRTTKEEMFGRWLADVFALPNCRDPYKIAAEGEYVNQLLLDKGMAELYRGDALSNL